MDRVNWRLRHFLVSYASGNGSEIDTNKLDFSNMLEQVKQRKYYTKSPTWIRTLMKKKERRPNDCNSGRDGDGGGGDDPRDPRR